MCLSLLFILIACSNEDVNNSRKEIVITKEYVEQNAKFDLTYDEVRELFGVEDVSEVVDHTETWLYDSTRHNEFDYKQSLEVVAHDEIKNADIDYQLFINFVGEKAFMYSYFYKGEDGKVWQYSIAPNSEPLEIPTSS